MNDYSYAQYIADLMRLPFGVGMLDFSDSKYKDMQVNFQIRYMLDRTQSMFTYEGLPETIPQRLLENILQTCGNACITRAPDGNLYAFWGGLGGEPDPYYQPTIYTVANPALNFSKNLKIGVDCVWARSDSMGVGLLPLFQWYGSMIVETGVSMRVGLINSRISRLMSASDDRTKKSAEKYLGDVEDGKLGVVSSSEFFDGLDLKAPPASGEHLTDIIETLQYLKASWFNDIGLNANYNMKRERIQNAESQLNDDALLPLIDDMLRSREQMVDEINAMYDLNISVRLNSAWEDEQENADDEVDNVDKIVDNNVEDPVDESPDPDDPEEKPEEIDKGSEEKESPEPEEMPENPDISITIINGDENTIEGGDNDDEESETIPASDGVDG